MIDNVITNLVSPSCAKDEATKRHVDSKVYRRVRKAGDWGTRYQRQPHYRPRQSFLPPGRGDQNIFGLSPSAESGRHRFVRLGIGTNDIKDLADPSNA